MGMSMVDKGGKRIMKKAIFGVIVYFGLGIAVYGHHQKDEVLALSGIFFAVTWMASYVFLSGK